MKNLNFCLLLSSVLCATHAFAINVVVETEKQLPLAHIRIAIPGGYIADPDGKNGTTSLLFQMLARGTKQKTKSQIDLALDDLGADIKTQVLSEYSVIEGSVLAANLKPFLDLLGEIVSQPSFRQDQLDRLRSQTATELNDALSSDGQLSSIRFSQLYYLGHPYAKSAQGRISDLPKISVQDLSLIHQATFKAKDWIVLAMGDVQESVVQNFASALETKLPGQFQRPKLNNPNHPNKIRAVIFNKPDRTQTVVRIGFKGTSIVDPNLDFVAFANESFGGGGFQSRLMQELRVKTGWTYGAGSNYLLSGAERAWNAVYMPKNADLKASLSRLMAMIREYKEKGMTEKEYEFTKNLLLNNSAFETDSAQKRASHRLLEIFYNLPKGYMAAKAERISEISLQQLNEFIAKFFDPKGMLVTLVGTAETSKKDFADALGIKAGDVEVVDYKREL